MRHLNIIFRLLQAYKEANIAFPNFLEPQYNFNSLNDLSNFFESYTAKNQKWQQSLYTLFMLAIAQPEPF